MSCRAGYSIFNDGTVRDWQQRGVQWTAGKNFFRSGSFGPWIVTKDEVRDPQALDLEVRVNGEVVQHANTREMIFPISELIAFITSFTPLEPGDVIATGTPAGIGLARTPPQFLRDGDDLQVEIESLGLLQNRVQNEVL